MYDVRFCNDKRYSQYNNSKNTYLYTLEADFTHVNFVLWFALTFALGMITAMDEAIGNVTQALKENALLDNTLIVFTSDVSKQ